jgi:hypothetical protein
MSSSQDYHLDHQGWWVSPINKLLLSQSLQWKVLKTLHQTYHLGVDNTLSLDKLVFESRKIRETLQDIIKGYETVSLITLTTNPFPGKWSKF